MDYLEKEGVLTERPPKRREISRRDLLIGAGGIAALGLFGGLAKRRKEENNRLYNREFDGKLREEGEFQTTIKKFEYKREFYDPVFRTDPKANVKNELSPEDIIRLKLGEGGFVAKKVYGNDVPFQDPILEKDGKRYWGWAKIDTNEGPVFIAENFVRYGARVIKIK